MWKSYSVFRAAEQSFPLICFMNEEISHTDLTYRIKTELFPSFSSNSSICFINFIIHFFVVFAEGAATTRFSKQFRHLITIIQWISIRVGIVGNSATRPGRKLRYLTLKIYAGLIGQHKIQRIDLYAAMLSKPRPGLDAVFSIMRHSWLYESDALELTAMSAVLSGEIRWLASFLELIFFAMFH
jgi:hypothetical protein